MMQKDGNEMTLINVLSILFLTHVGRAAKVRKQPASLRSDPGPHHRNRRPTSPEYAPANKRAAKTGGGIAHRARLELESKTGRKVVTGENYLPPSKSKKGLKA
jgi:hypothetical protein